MVIWDYPRILSYNHQVVDSHKYHNHFFQNHQFQILFVLHFCLSLFLSHSLLYVQQILSNLIESIYDYAKRNLSRLY